MVCDKSGAAAALLVTAMQVEVAAASIAAFGSYDRAVFFLIVLRQGLRRRTAAPDIRPRTISIHAIATDYGRAYATVWRHLHALAQDGYVTLDRRHVAVAHAALERPTVAALLHRIEGAFARLAQGAALARVPCGSPPVIAEGDARLTVAIDLFLCSVDDGGAWGWLAMVLIACVEWLEQDAPGSATIGRVARRLNLNYATAGRHIRSLVAHDVLAMRGHALTTSAAWQTGPNVERRDDAMLRCLSASVGAERTRPSRHREPAIAEAG